MPARMQENRGASRWRGHALAVGLALGVLCVGLGSLVGLGILSVRGVPTLTGAGEIAGAIAGGVVSAMLFCGICLRARHPVSTASVIQGVEMPLLMLSTAFIPVETLLSWLRPIILHQPFSPLIDTLRAILNGTPLSATGWEALMWLVGGAILGSFWVTRSLRRAS